MLHRKRNSKLVTMSATSVLAVVVAGAFNTSVSLAGDLPSTKQIVARMIRAQGGKTAMRKVKNRVMKLNVDLGIGGMTGKALVHLARPGNAHTTMEIQGMGTIEEGVNGDVAWSLSMMTGPQIKEGGERSLAIWEADFDGLANWKKHYKNLECVSKETIDGKEHYKVEMTPLDGSVITVYVDAETYLPYRTDMTLSTPMGDIAMSAYSEDYRAVDGVKYSHKSRIEVMGQTRVITVDSIEHNVKIPEDRFKLPDEIKALVEKNKGEKHKP